MKKIRSLCFNQKRKMWRKREDESSKKKKK